MSDSLAAVKERLASAARRNLEAFAPIAPSLEEKGGAILDAMEMAQTREELMEVSFRLTHALGDVDCYVLDGIVSNHAAIRATGIMSHYVFRKLDSVLSFARSCRLRIEDGREMICSSFDNLVIWSKQVGASLRSIHPNIAAMVVQYYDLDRRGYDPVTFLKIAGEGYSSAAPELMLAMRDLALEQQQEQQEQQEGLVTGGRRMR